MNFHQWCQHADRSDIKRVTWCCGDEPVLVEELVDRLRLALRPGAVDSVSLTAGTEPDRVIWAAAHQYPMQADVPRLVTIRHAEQLVDWHPLAGWLDRKRLNPMTYLLFVSSAATAPAHDHIGLIRRAGHIVECRRPPVSELVPWVQSMVPLTDATAGYLAQRSAGSLHQLKSVSGKLALFDEAPSAAAIDELCDEAPTDRFADAVMLLKGRVAHSLVPLLPTTDYRRIVGQLDSGLTVMAQLREAVHTGMSRRDIALLPDLPFSLAEKYLPVLDRYPSEHCRARWRVLATLDAALAAGARDGVLESLVTLWV